MNLFLCASIVVLSVVAAVLPVFSAETAETGGVKALAAGENVFALDLYGRLGATDGNLFFSPYSVSTCLAMTYAGARGETEKQMAQVLHFPSNQDQVHASFRELQRLLNDIQKKNGVNLSVANGLWAQQGHPFLPPFLELAQRDYEANLKQVDFRTQAEAARKEINDWVSDKTKGKISNLIPPGLLNSSSHLVLVNAIYFKGKWTLPFRAERTADAPFHAPGRDIQARLMSMNGKEFKYAEPEGLQLLELPYADGALSMVVLLPREQDGLKKLESTLDSNKLNDWLATAEKQKVNVFLPKFKLETSSRLDPTLEAMGMRDAFSRQADFSGIDGTRDLFLSAVVHKAFVDVNEEGTEAAAATGGIMAMKAEMPRKPIPTFRADHPFIFLIKENSSGSILFLGRLVEPAAGK